jgi:purine-binding chemotaxis protein CheW
MKTPEQYLIDSFFSPESEGPREYTLEERTFLSKYLGLELGAPQGGTGTPPRTALGEDSGYDRVQRREYPKASEIEKRLKRGEFLQLRSFTVHTRKYALPISVVQEVIRFIQPDRIPNAPPFIAGMITLRGRNTPIVLLEELFSIGAAGKKQPPTRFIVVCRMGELQVGLIIHSVSTMYRVGERQVEWTEPLPENGSDILAGQFKEEEKSIRIIAIDRLVEKIFC